MASLVAFVACTEESDAHVESDGGPPPHDAEASVVDAGEPDAGADACDVCGAWFCVQQPSGKTTGIGVRFDADGTLHPLRAAATGYVEADGYCESRERAATFQHSGEGEFVLDTKWCEPVRAEYDIERDTMYLQPDSFLDDLFAGADDTSLYILTRVEVISSLSCVAEGDACDEASQCESGRCDAQCLCDRSKPLCPE